MDYSLIEGLACFSAYGIILLGITKLCEVKKQSETNLFLHIVPNFIDILPIMILTFFGGILVNIIINSELIQPNGVDIGPDVILIIGFGLILPIFAPTYFLFDEIGEKTSNYFKMDDPRYSARICFYPTISVLILLLVLVFHLNIYIIYGFFIVPFILHISQYIQIRNYHRNR